MFSFFSLDSLGTLTVMMCLSHPNSTKASSPLPTSGFCSPQELLKSLVLNSQICLTFPHDSNFKDSDSFRVS